MKNLFILFTLLALFSSENLFSAGKDIFKYIEDNDFANIVREIENLSDVNITNHESFNSTPLMEVAFKLENENSKYQEIALMLLKKGANINYRNAFGSDALLYAVKLHTTDTFLKNCQKYGANLEIPYNVNKETLLHAAMENNHYLAPVITKYLLKNTKLVNARTQSGFTPLMLAMMSNCKHYEGCGFRREQIVDLVNSGALVDTEDYYYKLSALEFGIDSMNQTYVDDYQDLKFLIEHGAIVDQDAVDLAETPRLKEFLRSYLNN